VVNPGMSAPRFRGQGRGRGDGRDVRHFRVAGQAVQRPRRRGWARGKGATYTLACRRPPRRAGYSMSCRRHWLESGPRVKCRTLGFAHASEACRRCPTGFRRVPHCNEPLHRCTGMSARARCDAPSRPRREPERFSLAGGAPGCTLCVWMKASCSIAGRSRKHLRSQCLSFANSRNRAPCTPRETRMELTCTARRRYMH
jgi:hypothetical protein